MSCGRRLLRTVAAAGRYAGCKNEESVGRMKYDFDEVIDRTGTSCLKYDFAAERGMPEDVLSLWVADMDFHTAQPILDRLHRAVEHGIFGYTEGKEEYFDAVHSWYQTRFHWDVKRSWLIKTPGVVFSLAMAVRAFSEAGDAVLIQQPVYYPFSGVIKDNGRTLVNSPLVLTDGHYEIDFEDFERKITENDVKLFLLCSPHNPVGRVWKEWELKRIGEICLRHHVIVAADEIHSDFVYPGNEHRVFADLCAEFADISVTCTAPSKTFNLAGLQISNIFIPNRELRRRFRGEVNSAGYSQVNTMGLFACQAAYEEGGEWLSQLKDYLYENLLFVKEYLEENMPQIRLIWPEGTYLIWLDCRGLGISDAELNRRIVHEAKLWLDAGNIFGESGEGFLRINIACPRSTLKEALERMKRIVY